MESGGFDLKWKNHLKEVVGNIRVLREKNAFSDITLFCDGEVFRAHKVLLAACSSFFERLLARLPPSKSDCIVLLETRAEMLNLALEFMYNGEVYVAAEALTDFMATAEKMEIRGLRKTEDSGDREEGHPRGENSGAGSRKRSAPMYIDHVAPDVEIREPDDDERSLPTKVTKSNHARNGSVGSPEQMGFGPNGGDSRKITGSPTEAASGSRGRRMQSEETMEEEGGDWNDEDGFYGGGEGDDDQFPCEASFGGGDDERPQNIPPEISPTEPIFRWKPELPIWHGKSSTTGNQLYFCGLCDYTSLYNWNVKTHLMKHTGEKPYRCSICNWASRYKSSLKNHLGSRHSVFL